MAGWRRQVRAAAGRVEGLVRRAESDEGEVSELRQVCSFPLACVVTNERMSRQP